MVDEIIELSEFCIWKIVCNEMKRELRIGFLEKVII